jgi:hypothetical protein
MLSPDHAARPLIVVGMHRSGTSLVGSLLMEAGIDLGPELLGAGTGNARGHFEDVDFLRLHQRALQSQGLGVHGYVTAGDIEFPDALVEEAQALIVSRLARGVPWGWKDPRTTLFLDFWDQLLPEARYLCVFRRPWEVVDSLLRRGHEVDEMFSTHPEIAAAVWKHYNQKILALLDRYPHRCMLLESTQLAADPAGLIARISDVLSLPMTAAREVFEPSLFHRDDSSSRPLVVEAVCPGTNQLYLELRKRASSDSPLPPAVTEMPDLAMISRMALLERVRAEEQRREAQATALHCRELVEALHSAHAALTETHTALDTTHKSLKETHAHLQSNVDARLTLEDDNAMLRCNLESLWNTWHARFIRAVLKLFGRHHQRPWLTQARDAAHREAT